jgi:hypothetical protein
MRPYSEPAAGVTTQALTDQHGPIVARARKPLAQYVQFRDGFVFESVLVGGRWCAWSKSTPHPVDVDRFAGRIGASVEHVRSGALVMRLVAAQP